MSNSKTTIPPKTQNRLPIPGRSHGPGGPMGSRVHGQKPKSTKQTLLRLLSYIGKSKYTLILLLLTMSFATTLDLLGPKLQGIAIDSIHVRNNTITVDFEQLVHILIFMACIFIISSIFTYIQGLLSARISQDTVFLMRNDLFEKITRLPISFTDSHSHGDLMSRMTNDVENVSNAVSQSIASLLSSILTFLLALFFMLRCNVIVTLIAFITVPLTLMLSGKLAKYMKKYVVSQQILLGQLNSQIEEQVTSYKTVVAYNKENEAIENFSKSSEELRKISIHSHVVGSIMGPCMNFLGNFQYVLVASFGIYFYIHGKVSVGNIQSMLQYSKKFNRPINEIANQYAAIMTALAGAERIFEIMDTNAEVDEGTTLMDPNAVTGHIRFNNVSFGYEKNTPVLKHLNLDILPGQKIALVGATGSGKTTIVNLLTRFYEINEGEILIDSKNITDIPKSDLRKSIAIVLQDTVLFADTIKNNISYGSNEASKELIEFAAHTSKADLFINRLPNQYETLLTEGGSNLSQGQRQLLAIARAVIANPSILILDEATSNVDTRTEMHIQQAMVSLMKDRTSLIIAHRLSTIRDADKIVVLSNGEIAECGNHEELLKLQGEYYKLYQNQFAGLKT